LAENGRGRQMPCLERPAGHAEASEPASERARELELEREQASEKSMKERERERDRDRDRDRDTDRDRGRETGRRRITRLRGMSLRLTPVGPPWAGRAPWPAFCCSRVRAGPSALWRGGGTSPEHVSREWIQWNLSGLATESSRPFASARGAIFVAQDSLRLCRSLGARILSPDTPHAPRHTRLCHDS
jgi:hypothetical protein